MVHVSRDCKLKRCSAFTLVELLVVIGIIALLISILLPTLSKVRRQAQFTKCAANLHDIGLALFNYTAQNKGALPQFTANPDHLSSPPPGGNWLWDMEAQTRDTLVKFGAQRPNLYCPIQADTQNVDALWNFAVTANPDGSNGGFSVLGYFFLIFRPDGSYPNITPSLFDQPQNDTNWVIQSWRYQKYQIPNNSACNPPRSSISSETEIVTDATADDGAGHFGNIIGGYSVGGHSVPNQSAHWFGGLPVGGNILFMDGHVTNRLFNKGSIPGSFQQPNDGLIMHYRASTSLSSQGSTSVRFFF